MKRLFFLLLFFIVINEANAQKYYTKNGTISFFSSTSMEDIKADNSQVMAVLDAQTGALQFSLLVKGFHFKKALMEEHFNENYMESAKFPKAAFRGTITDINKVNFSQDGIYNVNVTGDLVIHGVTKNFSAPATVRITGGKVAANAKFWVAVADFNIKIPSLVKNNISESVEVTVNCNLDNKM